jgi:hypothetical protein
MGRPATDFIATEAGAQNYEPLGVVLSRGEGVPGYEVWRPSDFDELSARMLTQALHRYFAYGSFATGLTFCQPLPVYPD